MVLSHHSSKDSQMVTDEIDWQFVTVQLESYFLETSYWSVSTIHFVPASVTPDVTSSVLLPRLVPSIVTQFLPDNVEFNGLTWK